MIKAKKKHNTLILNVGFLLFFCTIIISCAPPARVFEECKSELLPSSKMKLVEIVDYFYMEDIYVKENNFSNLGTDSFYRMEPYFIRNFNSQNFEESYLKGTYLFDAGIDEEVYKYLLDNNIDFNERKCLEKLEKLIKVKTTYHPVTSFKKRLLRKEKCCFRYRKYKLKMTCLYMGTGCPIIPDDKSKKNIFIKRINNVPIYKIIDFELVSN